MPTTAIPLHDLPTAAQAARLEAEHLWAYTHRLTPWTAYQLDDGTITLSAQITTRGGTLVLAEFAARAYDHFEGRPRTAGDQLPALDVSVPGREACVWRTGGVWVELWHPTVVPAGTSPSGARSARVVRPARRGLAGARLPFGRRRKTPTS